MTLNALTFSIPASVMCLPGNVAVDSGGETPSPCCTGVGTIDDKKKHPKDPKLPYGPGVNYLGFSALSDGAARQTGRGQGYRRNQDRFFFCGERLGATNLVVGRTKGPRVLRVRSSDTYWGEIDEEKRKKKKRRRKRRNKFSIPFLLLWTPDLHNRLRPGDSSSCHICGILHGFPSQSDNFYKPFFQSTQHLRTTSTPARGLFWGHHAVLQYS